MKGINSRENQLIKATKETQLKQINKFIKDHTFIKGDLPRLVRFMEVEWNEFKEEIK